MTGQLMNSQAVAVTFAQIFARFVEAKNANLDFCFHPFFAQSLIVAGNRVIVSSVRLDPGVATFRLAS
jgi:hypothetical protein